jgi:hypothetical protein
MPNKTPKTTYIAVMSCDVNSTPTEWMVIPGAEERPNVVDAIKDIERVTGGRSAVGYGRKKSVQRLTENNGKIEKELINPIDWLWKNA